MTLSHGSTAVHDGSLAKGLPIMVLGGVLAWVTGLAWTGEGGSARVLQLVLVFGTLITVSVPTQLVAGPRARPWLMATLGAAGLGGPWFFGLAVQRQGQDVMLETAMVTAAAWLLVYAVTWATRRVLRRSLQAQAQR